MTNSTKPARNPRLGPTIMVAVIGASLFLLFLSRDLPGGLGDEWARDNLSLVLRYVLAMTFGGALMGYLLASMFGRKGVGGWLLALLGGILATLVAGFFGSFFGLLPDLLADGWQAQDLVAILFGFLVLPLAAAENLASSLIWLIMVFATHLLTKSMRARSDTANP